MITSNPKIKIWKAFNLTFVETNKIIYKVICYLIFFIVLFCCLKKLIIAFSFGKCSDLIIFISFLDSIGNDYHSLQILFILFLSLMGLYLKLYYLFIFAVLGNSIGLVS